MLNREHNSRLLEEDICPALAGHEQQKALSRHHRNVAEQTTGTAMWSCWIKEEAGMRTQKKFSKQPKLEADTSSEPLRLVGWRNLPEACVCVCVCVCVFVCDARKRRTEECALLSTRADAKAAVMSVFQKVVFSLLVTQTRSTNCLWLCGRNW